MKHACAIYNARGVAKLTNMTQTREPTLPDAVSSSMRTPVMYTKNPCALNVRDYIQNNNRSATVNKIFFNADIWRKY